MCWKTVGWIRMMRVYFLMGCVSMCVFAFIDCRCVVVSFSVKIIGLCKYTRIVALFIKSYC